MFTTSGAVTEVETLPLRMPPVPKPVALPASMNEVVGVDLDAVLERCQKQLSGPGTGLVAGIVAGFGAGFTAGFTAGFGAGLETG